MSRGRGGSAYPRAAVPGLRLLLLAVRAARCARLVARCSVRSRWVVWTLAAFLGAMGWQVLRRAYCRACAPIEVGG